MPPKNKDKPIAPEKRDLKEATNPPESINASTAADLRPAGYNPRTISPEKLEMLRKAMLEYGDLSGVVFNRRTGRLVGGHQRLKTLQPDWPIIKAEHTDKTGTVAIGHIETPDGRWSYREVDWSEQKEKAANIAANKHGGEWDDPLLAQLLEELHGQGYDADLLGFDQAELDDILGLNKKEKLGPEDPPTEPVFDPFIQTGDLWLCGEHRLLVGDSTKVEDIDRLLAGEKMDAVWTDPPYNVAYESKVGKIENDNMPPEEFYLFIRALFASMSHALRPGGVFYIAHAEGNGIGDIFRRALTDTKGMLMKQCLIWVKSSAVLCRQDYNWKHEPILYGWKEGAAHFFNQDFTQTTVIDDDVDVSKMEKKQLAALITELRNAIPSTIIRADKPPKSDLHPTQKPVYLVGKNIIASTMPGDKVMDICGGSGTTMIACRKLRRKARLMEYDPKYAQAILYRYQDYCGEEPQLLADDGNTIPLSEVRKQRGK